MNRRLQEFILAENISQSQFADSIGVARASISHILSGRNKPGFDFIVSMSKRYPNLNLEWLINGEGDMYKTPASNDSVSKDRNNAQDSPAVSESVFDSHPARQRQDALDAERDKGRIQQKTAPESVTTPYDTDYRQMSSRLPKQPQNTLSEPSFDPQPDGDLFSSYYDEITPSKPLPSVAAAPSRPSPFRKAAHYDQTRQKKNYEMPQSPLRSSFADVQQARNISRIIVLFNDGTFQELK